MNPGVFRAGIRLPAWLLLSLAGVLVAPGVGAGAERQGISQVSISRQFFNPTLGQKIDIAFSLTDGGKLSILILDRDGYLVRRLVSEKTAAEGKRSVDWDGRDDKGEIVPDEAYSLKIDLESAGGSATYFPFKVSGEPLEGVTPSFDPTRGIVAYRLARPARVSIVAVASDGGKKSAMRELIVDREPRTLGAIVEPWNGYDRTGRVKLAERAGFHIEVEARALPENSLITVGNRKVSFAERVLKRSGSAPRIRKESDHV